jgi:hypothetical protein
VGDVRANDVKRVAAAVAPVAWPRAQSSARSAIGSQPT